MSNEICSKCSTKIEGDVVHIVWGPSGIQGCCQECWDKEQKTIGLAALCEMPDYRTNKGPLGGRGERNLVFE